VSFVGTLRHPLRFRDAISALHDVVISDLRFKPRDKSSYEQWKKDEMAREAAIRSAAATAKRAELETRQRVAVTLGLEQRFNRCRTRY
jgi:hypothetical protein